MKIHIRGPAGSGKTTLGRWVRAHFPDTCVIELDDLFDREANRGAPPRTTHEETRRYMQIHRRMDDQIDRVVHSAPHVVFIGESHEVGRVDRVITLVGDARSNLQYHQRTLRSIVARQSRIARRLRATRGNDIAVRWVVFHDGHVREGFPRMGDSTSGATSRAVTMSDAKSLLRAWLRS